jgi:hypothetical protein
MNNTPRNRAIIYGIHDSKRKLYALAVADPINRTVESFIGDLTNVGPLLAKYDAIIGITPDKLLTELGLAPQQWRWRVDISPPQKTKKLNKQGRILKITTELLVSGTVGISRALGDPQKIAFYIREGDNGKLAKRIESTAKALCAYYNYGCNNLWVRLRWGFLNEIVGAENWQLPGDVTFYEMLSHAAQKQLTVEIVAGSAPGWTEPWSRGQTVKVQKVGISSVIILINGNPNMRSVIDRNDIQAVRFT